jgi:hypothetical protein
MSNRPSLTVLTTGPIWKMPPPKDRLNLGLRDNQSFGA